MSYNQARKHSYNPNIEDCVIISIKDWETEARFNNHNPHIKGILHLNFNDVEGDEPHCMSRADAERIIEFVNQHVNNVQHIVVHCEAGVSRSAGTCAALMQIVNGDDSEIFNNPRFCPNMHCYRTVLTAYFGYYNEEAADEKIKHHLILWRKYHELD